MNSESITHRKEEGTYFTWTKTERERNACQGEIVREVVRERKKASIPLERAVGSRQRATKGVRQEAVKSSFDHCNATIVCYLFFSRLS
jgi:hypothetical protein